LPFIGKFGILLPMFRNSYIAELVHDISFAVFRVSALIEHAFLRKELEMSAVELSTYVDESSIHKLERLINLANSLEEISDINTSVLNRELANLKELLVAEYMEEMPDEDISGMFEKNSQELPFKKEISNGNETRSGKEPSKRQTEILEFIRQFDGNCRMSDLATRFGEVSKRTLRNDISSLIREGRIERIGSRGPYSYLKAIKEGGRDTIYNKEGEQDNDHVNIEEGSTILLSGPKVGIFDTFE